jgi:hypothetical protein
MRLWYASERPHLARAYAMSVAVGVLAIDASACAYIFARVFYVLGRLPAGTAVRPVALAVESLIVTVLAVSITLAALTLALLLDARRRAIWVVAVVSLVLMCLPYQSYFWAVDMAVRWYGLALGS